MSSQLRLNETDSVTLFGLCVFFFPRNLPSTALGCWGPDGLGDFTILPLGREVTQQLLEAKMGGRVRVNQRFSAEKRKGCLVSGQS